MPLRPISKELQEKAINELHEVPDRTEDDIKQIRDWLEKQPHLNVRMEDQWLLNFLRCSKFSIQRTKERLDYFYTMRTLAPEFFTDRDPLLPEIQDILKRGLVVPVPMFDDPAAPIILLCRWKNADPAKNSCVNIIKALLMGADILLNENDNFSIAGAITVEDLQDSDLNYAKQLTPAICKKLILCIQNAYPIRIKQFNCFNVSSSVEMVLNLFKLFMNEKLKKRVNIYGKKNFDGIYKTIPLSVLPKQYGGNGGCLDEMTAELKKKVESYRDWFLEDAQYCSDEARRPEKPKTSADVFGIEGSFRKLVVD